jgi:hypothetical protein
MRRAFHNQEDRAKYIDQVLTNAYVRERSHDLDMDLDYGWPEAIPYEDLEHRAQFILRHLDWYTVDQYMMPVIGEGGV